MNKTQKLYEEAKKIIPGGTQLLSKRQEMYAPGLWPAYYKKAKGCEVWDLDGKKYLDMSSMGIGSCILGYADPDVNRQVKRAIDKASITTLNCFEEVELAKILLDLHPWAEKVRFARCGGEAMAIAVRIARAKTKKDVVLFCGYHGWHDWYLSANLADDKNLDGHLLAGLNPLGVPRGLKGTAIPFQYNNAKEFIRVFKENINNVGAIILEPIRNIYPHKEFIDKIHTVCLQYSIPLIVDEVSTGFRLCLGGAHLILGIKPDIAVFAKAMSNGFPMGAIIGKKNVMNIAQDTFISSTYWTERIGPTAAIATISKMKARKVDSHLKKIGELIMEGWKKAAKKNNIKIHISGFATLSHFDFVCENKLAAKTFFVQEMLKKGFLATNGFYPSFAHKEKHVKRYLSALNLVFIGLSASLKKRDLAKRLKGQVCQSGFQRLN